MLRPVIRLFRHRSWFCALVWAATATSAWAADTLQIEQLETRRVRELMDQPGRTLSRGFIKTIKAPRGKCFLMVWMKLKVPAEANNNRNQPFQFGSEAMRMSDSKKHVSSPIGRASEDGRFDPGAGQTYFGQPTYGLVFLVAEEETSFSLEFGPAKRELKCEDQVTDRIDAAGTAKFSIGNVKILKTVSTKEQLGPSDQPIQEFEETVRATTERFVAVDVTVEGKISNTGIGGNFVFCPNDIGLLYGGQVYACPVGYVGSIGLETESHPINAGPKSDGGFLTIATTLIFPLPKGISKFRLLYLLEPVADGAVLVDK